MDEHQPAPGSEDLRLRAVGADGESLERAGGGHRVLLFFSRVSTSSVSFLREVMPKRTRDSASSRALPPKNCRLSS
jgi:hypothetical protein